MKLSKFAKIVKDSGSCIAWTMDNKSQWLSNGFGVYRASDLPEIKSHEQMAATLDIEQKKAESIKFLTKSQSEYKGPCLAEWDATETQAKHIEMMAVKDGEAFTCVKANNELLFYNDYYLTPLADAIKDSVYINYVVRQDPFGQKWLVVKDGMIVVGAVAARKVVTEEYIDHLHEFLCDCQAQLERENAAKQPEETE